MDRKSRNGYRFVTDGRKGGMGMRKHFLDNIRWVTVVIVVVYHVLYMYNAEGILGGLGKVTDLAMQPWDVVQYLVYPWMMPVLFLVAGISARLSLDRRSEREFVRNRTRRLLVPSTIGVVVFHVVQGYVSLSLGTAFDDLARMQVPTPVVCLIMVASGTGVLWFMHLLWLYCMVLVVVRRREKGRLLSLGEKTPTWMLAAFYLVVWGAGQVLNTPIVSVYRVAFYFAFFLLGYYVFSHDATMERLKRWAVPLIVSAILLCVSFSLRYFVWGGGQNYADAPVNRGPLYVACAYVGSLALLSAMARFGDVCNGFTQWMSKMSFGLYVFHYLGVSTVALVLAKPGRCPAVVCYLMSLVAGFAFGYGLQAVVSRIPFLRWAVLGISESVDEGSGTCSVTTSCS